MYVMHASPGRGAVLGLIGLVGTNAGRDLFRHHFGKNAN